MLLHNLQPQDQDDHQDRYNLMVIVDHPWCGLGWMIGAAASWLDENYKSTYVYMSNQFYHARDGGDQSNKWEWFFDQKLYGSPYQVRRSRDIKVLPCNSKHKPSVVLKLRRLAARYWTVKSEIINIAKTFVPDPTTTLGVHYRGTDKSREIPRPDLDMVAKQVRGALETHNLSKVLLATDDERALVGLRERLPTVSCFTDHLRGTSDVGIHQQYGGYRQAMETMVEIMAIGMTAHALVGRSSVADAMLLLADPLQSWTYYN